MNLWSGTKNINEAFLIIFNKNIESFKIGVWTRLRVIQFRVFLTVKIGSVKISLRVISWAPCCQMSSYILNLMVPKGSRGADGTSD